MVSTRCRCSCRWQWRGRRWLSLGFLLLLLVLVCNVLPSAAIAKEKKFQVLEVMQQIIRLNDSALEEAGAGSLQEILSSHERVASFFKNVNTNQSDRSRRTTTTEQAATEQHLSSPNITLTNADVLFSIGEVLLYGDPRQGIQRNGSLAMEFLEQSASLGHEHAQFLLAMLHSSGTATIPTLQAMDLPKSVLFQHFASLHDMVGATIALGYRHLHGIGVPKSCESSIKYYKRAADQAMNAHEFNNRLPVQGFFINRLQDSLSDQFKVVDEHEHDQQLEYMKRSAMFTTSVSYVVRLAKFLLFGEHKSSSAFAEAKMYLERAINMVPNSKSLEQDVRTKNVAMALLGHLYAYGLGVTVNPEQAIELYTRAINNQTTASPEAFTGLGLVYLNGLGVDVNIEKAMHYFKQAASFGDAEGVYNVALLKLITNPLDAFRNFQAASRVGHVRSTLRLARMFETGKGVSADLSGLLSKSGRKHAYACQRAVKLYKKVAETHPFGLDLMAHASSRFLQKDYPGALLFYMIAAEMGYEIAQTNAAWMIQRGYGFYGLGGTGWDSQAHIQARRLEDLYVRLLNQARDQNNEKALVLLGDLYYYGRLRTPVDGIWDFAGMKELVFGKRRPTTDTKIDYEKAFELYEAAAMLSNAEALYNAAYMYERGIGTDQSYPMAKKYYQVAGKMEPRVTWMMNVLAWRVEMIERVTKEIPTRLGEWQEMADKKWRELKTALGVYSSVQQDHEGTPPLTASWPSLSQSSTSNRFTNFMHNQQQRLQASQDRQGLQLDQRHEFHTVMEFTEASRLSIQLDSATFTCAKPFAIDQWIKHDPVTEEQLQKRHLDPLLGAKTTVLHFTGCFSLDLIHMNQPDDATSRHFRVSMTLFNQDPTRNGEMGQETLLTRLVLDASSWYHLGVVFDGKRQITFYLNGKRHTDVQVDLWSKHKLDRRITTDYYVRQGWVGAFEGRHHRLAGQIGGIRVWKTELNDQEMTFLSQNPASPQEMASNQVDVSPLLVDLRFEATRDRDSQQKSSEAAPSFSPLEVHNVADSRATSFSSVQCKRVALRMTMFPPVLAPESIDVVGTTNDEQTATSSEESHSPQSKQEDL